MSLSHVRGDDTTPLRNETIGAALEQALTIVGVVQQHGPLDHFRRASSVW